MHIGIEYIIIFDSWSTNLQKKNIRENRLRKDYEDAAKNINKRFCSFFLNVTGETIVGFNGYLKLPEGIHYVTMSLCCQACQGVYLHEKLLPSDGFSTAIFWSLISWRWFCSILFGMIHLYHFHSIFDITLFGMILPNFDIF